MTHDDVQRWIDAYLDAWRTYDPAAIGDLFAERVTYRYQPYRPPFEGRAAVVDTWLDDKDAPGSWTARLEPFTVDGDRAVVVGECRYLEPDGSQRTVFFNVWLITFDADGRCLDFVEYWREPPEDIRTSI